MADLELRQDGDVIWATMNRPERLNALSRNLVKELRDFFVGLYWRHEVRVQACGTTCSDPDLRHAGMSGVWDGQRRSGQVLQRMRGAALGGARASPPLRDSSFL